MSGAGEETPRDEPVDYKDMSDDEYERLCTVFVKNLNFDTTDEDLWAAFSEYGLIRTVRVPKRPSGVSKGFAFIVFENPECAQKAVQGMNGTKVDGWEISVNISERSKGEPDKQSEVRRDSDKHRNTRGEDRYDRDRERDRRDRRPDGRDGYQRERYDRRDRDMYDRPGHMYDRPPPYMMYRYDDMYDRYDPYMRGPPRYMDDMPRPYDRSPEDYARRYPSRP